MNIVETKGLKKYFKRKKQLIKAVDGVDIFIKKKQVTALVGESGCGKTTLAKTLLGFYNADGGRIILEDKDITRIRENYSFVRERIQIVFQNPSLSIDPRYTVFRTLLETLRVFKKVSIEMAKGTIIDFLNKAGLDETCLYLYPHQLSGGQAQRVSIARALINNPRVVILDEPTSNLDVSTTVKIIDLLAELKDKESLSYFFISHNLKLIAKVADYIFVMYYGKIVECGPKDILYRNPLHPYTKLLIEASEYKLKSAYIQGKLKKGCVFRGHCAIEKPHCEVEPEAKEVEPGHFVFCHYI